MKDRDEADRLVRLLVAKRYWCQRCGGEGNQVAHIMRRRFSATRCEEANLWWLCGACHDLVDMRAWNRTQVGALNALVAVTIGEEVFYELRQLAYEGPKMPSSMFWAGEVERLRKRCRHEGITP